MTPTIITDRKIPARWLFDRMSPDQADEVRAFTAAIDGSYAYVTDIEYDVIDCPLIRVTRKVVDERGACRIAPDGKHLMTTTVERPLTVPLPDWWRP